MNIIKSFVVWVIKAVATIIGTLSVLMFSGLMNDHAVSSGAQLGTGLFSLFLSLICLYFVVNVFIMSPIRLIRRS